MINTDGYIHTHRRVELDGTVRYGIGELVPVTEAIQLGLIDKDGSRLGPSDLTRFSEMTEARTIQKVIGQPALVVQL